MLQSIGLQRVGLDWAMEQQQQRQQYIYIYIYNLFHFLFHYGLLQGIEYSSLCYTVGSCLSILYSRVFIR